MTTAPRSITDLLAHGAARLAAVSDSPRLDAELLLAHLRGRSVRAQLLIDSDQILPTSDIEKFAALLERRARGEPIAYIVGTRDFWTLTLEVGPGVLVPRPETELLVELALAAGDAMPARDAIRVIDLGTGSGAIALSIATERPMWRVTATDRSPQALTIARRNAARTGLDRVEFAQGDWLAAVPQRSFDVIVSNPPYIAAADAVLASAPLTFEPRSALTDEADGLQDLLRIADAARGRLSADGVLLLEHAPDQASALRAALESRGYGHVRSHRDLARRERVTSGAAPVAATHPE